MARRMKNMKKKLTMGAALLLALSLLLLGCNENHNTANTFGNTTKGLYLYADLSLEWVEYLPFGEDYYDAAEFKGILESDVAAYNSTVNFVKPEMPVNSKGNPIQESKVTAPVSVVKCETAGKELKMQLRYANVEDFLAYTERFQGSDPGYTILTGTLAKPDSQIVTASYVGTDGKEVNLNDLVNSSDAASYRYALVDMDAVLYGDDYIVAYSATGAYNETANCVTAKAGTTVIVIFKSSK